MENYGYGSCCLLKINAAHGKAEAIAEAAKKGYGYVVEYSKEWKRTLWGWKIKIFSESEALEHFKDSPKMLRFIKRMNAPLVLAEMPENEESDEWEIFPAELFDRIIQIPPPEDISASA